jgi:hypothetical protein
LPASRPRISGRAVAIQYCLLKGMNNSAEHARTLASALGAHRIYVSLGERRFFVSTCKNRRFLPLKASMRIFNLLLICALSLVFLNGCVTAPPVADQSDYAGFDYVTNIDGMKKDAIYEGVELWIAENFKPAKHVIDLENKEQGIIVCNGVISNIILDMGSVKMPLEASFKMKVEVKDGKMRLSFSAYQVTMRQNTSLYKMEADQIKTKLSKFGEEIAKYLKTEKKGF